MAIKYGRPIESRTRVVPIDPATSGKRAARLDLTERPRRLRRAEWIRRMVREHTISTADLIWPLFVSDGQRSRVPVASMPGVEPRQRAAADVVLYVDAAEAQRRGLAQLRDRECLVLVPGPRLRRHLVAGELPRGRLKGALVFGQLKIHRTRSIRAVLNPVNGSGYTMVALVLRTG